MGTGAATRNGRTTTLDDESSGSTLRVTIGDRQYASPPSLSVTEIEANRATATHWMLAVFTANNRRSHVENGAVTGDAARSNKTHAQAVRIMSERCAVT
jgi:hypothetical protein